jgi:Thioredoxin
VADSVLLLWGLVAPACGRRAPHLGWRARQIARFFATSPACHFFVTPGPAPPPYSSVFSEMHDACWYSPEYAAVAAVCLHAFSKFILELVSQPPRRAGARKMVRMLAALATAALAASSALAADVLTLTGETFAAAVKEHEKLVVEFYAPWCAPSSRACVPRSLA